ncbi:TPA: hypothetical protein TY419_000683 [Streptococcus suis]|nr:hypothetical protein [Streptococcus suis]HEM2582024.1 hypothetical protein [Streptococcus suis]
MKKIILYYGLLLFNFPLVVTATTSTTTGESDWKSWGTLVASVIAAIGTTINMYIQRRNHKEALRAQVLAKARIQWMKEVREVFTQFVERSADYELALSLYDLSDDKAKMEELYQSINRTQSYFWASLHHLCTYFPDSSDKRNQEVRATFETLAEYLEEYNTYIFSEESEGEFRSEIKLLKDESPSVYYSVALYETSQSLAKYLKSEWKHVKNEAIGKE